MTPTEQEIEFFKEAKRIQGLWEPKFGDWVRLAPHDLYDFEDGIIVLPADNAEDIVVVRTDDHQHLLLYPSELIWLPRQGQLQAMLEERGYEHGLMWDLWGPRRPEPEKRYMLEVTSRLGKTKFFAPTPSIALALALLEVLKEEQDEG